VPIEFVSAGLGTGAGAGAVSGVAGATATFAGRLFSLFGLEAAAAIGMGGILTCGVSSKGALGLEGTLTGSTGACGGGTAGMTVR
jgi:hypothetical protein